MKLYEFQGYELFAKYGIPVAHGRTVSRPEDAEAFAAEVGGAVVIKAQVLAGGRGKAGGVKVAKTPAEARAKAAEILGLSIKGIPVQQVLVVPAARIVREFYAAITVDRTAQGIILMLSAAGGMDIEELAVRDPGAIVKVRLPVKPAERLAELDAAVARVFGGGSLGEQARGILSGLHRVFVEQDCSLAEINPLAEIEGGRLMALDSKIVLDDNGLIRHPELEKYRNAEEYSDHETRAREAGLSFVSMDGDIGCIVNGAGLAMATMDLIKYFGGSPANFLDVGGSSNPEKVLNALGIIMDNPRVKAILINIFGGITRCDDISRGILLALSRIRIPVPMVIRLIGTNDEEGRAILAQAGLTSMEDLSEAVKLVVAEARKPS